MNVETKRTYTADEIKSEVRQTLVQLNELTRTQADFNQFVNTVLGRIVALTGAHGALLWQTNGQGQLQITHATGTRVKEIVPDTEQHGHLVMEVIAKETPLGLTSESVVVAGESKKSIKNTTPFLLLFAPIHNRKKVCCGTIELLQRSEISQSAQDGYLNFLGQISKLFPRWHEQQDLRRLSNKETTWSTKMNFVTEVHRSIELKETTFALANEVRRLLNCDRVSVALWNGRKCKVDAISSQDKFDNRSNVVRKLGNVATNCVSADTPLWLIGDTDGLAPNLAKQVNEYLDESHSRTFIVVPLLDRPKVDSDQSDQTRRHLKAKKLGAMIIEFFDTEVSETQIAEDYKLATVQSELALANAERHTSIFMQPILQKVGWLQQLLFRDHRIKTLVGALLLLATILFLCFFPKEHKMKIHGVLQPVLRRDIHTIAEGQMVKFYVDHGDWVKKGEKLFEQKSFNLDLQITDINRKINAAESEIKFNTIQMSKGRLNAEERATMPEKIKSLRNQQKDLEGQRDLLMARQEDLVVRSKIDGQVLTWDVKNRLEGKPFGANAYVLTVADIKGNWNLEMKIPEGKTGYISGALSKNDGEPLEVDYHIATNPSKTLDGELVQIAERAEMGQSGQKEFRAIITADPDSREGLQPGVGVTARVHCGKRPIGFVWTYQIIDYFRTWFF
jgi:transcriptional regulator with GAF, ATPase, and Fis domain